jgi:uncharacterized protein (TIGR02147 family)
MSSLFDFNDYRKFLTFWIESQENHGYGIKGKIASALNISSTLVSLVLKGDKSFSADQMSHLCDFMGLSELESDYLHLLLELDRAATQKYKVKLNKKILQLQNQSKKISSRVQKSKELTDEQKAIYYSSWLYTGIRNLSAIDKLKTKDAIANHLNLDASVVNQVVRFLLDNGLCKEEQGKIVEGPVSVFIPKESPFINKHHQNWRMQSIQKMEYRRESDLFFSAPMSLSKEAFDKIRKLLPDVVQQVSKIVGPSKSESAACLNIDFFEY